MEKARDNPDYHKLQVIETFKKIKTDYLQAHKSKTSAFDEDPVAEK